MKRMKATVSWMLAMLMALSLSACGSKQQPQPDAAQPVETQKPVEPAPVENQTPAVDQAATSREQTAQLVYSPEGQEESVSATLYTGDGYSIYIPDEGWMLETDYDDGMPEESWDSVRNDDVELRVLHLGDRDLKTAQALVIADEDDFQLSEDGKGGLSGVDPTDREVLEVRFHEGKGGMYVLMYHYPQEAAEGFGTLLSAMADTFEAVK